MSNKRNKKKKITKRQKIRIAWIIISAIVIISMVAGTIIMSL
ncbi:MAG TPA: hypothetical protein PLX67_00235 [bacterium]|nr:hypothetical protein [bacterium]HNZ51461.1 hypothetical protein [bacterium]HOF79359.1 hypothetical protein [bacterium]HOH85618.1 hypothetical protein [bacterium]HOQ91518.1 hypothetical protein [bacterium]